MGPIDKFRWLSITDFSEAQLKAYLDSKGAINSVPRWLPRKPLLVGYFITRNLSSLLTEGRINEDVGKGWNSLLTLICEREVGQVETGLYASELLSLYARIATKSRKTIGKTGPITFRDIRESFNELFGFEAEGRSLAALLRLPGLTSSSFPSEVNDEEGARYFVDESFVDAAAARDVLQILKNPYDSEKMTPFMGLRHQLSEVGVHVAAYLAEAESILESRVQSALTNIAKRYPENVTSIDLIQIFREIGARVMPNSIMLSGQLVEELYLDVDDCDLSKILIRDSYFKRAYFDVEDVSLMPHFASCYFGQIRSNYNMKKYQDKMEQCEFESVEIVEPSVFLESGDMKLAILQSILDKLFFQSLSGREERALTRGLPPAAITFVPEIIEILRKDGFCFRRTLRGNAIWYPTKAKLGDVRELIATMDKNKFPILEDIQKLK